MSKAIPIEWIDKHLEWLDNCDNEFAQLAAVSIRSMVKIWQSEQMLAKAEDNMIYDAPTIEIVAHGNCARCGKPVEGNSIFLCDECKSLIKGAEDEQ